MDARRGTDQEVPGARRRAARQLCARLDRALAAMALLALRLRTARWAALGVDDGIALQLVLDEQLDELDAQADALAGRMRELGAYPGATVDGWVDLAALGDDADDMGRTRELVEELLRDQGVVAEAIAAARELAEAEGDATTVALLHDLSLGQLGLASALRAEAPRSVPRTAPRSVPPSHPAPTSVQVA